DLRIRGRIARISGVEEPVGHALIGRLANRPAWAADRIPAQVNVAERAVRHLHEIDVGYRFPGLEGRGNSPRGDVIFDKPIVTRVSFRWGNGRALNASSLRSDTTVEKR